MYDRKRPFHTAGLNIYRKILAAIRNLQRTNDMVRKHLADTYDRMEVRMLIKQILYWECIDYSHFDKVYVGFVEKKRQSLLKDIDKIDNQFTEYRRKRQEAGLPNEGAPAETCMKQAVLETYYAYLGNDDAYQQKAFVLFLEKKMEEMADNGEEYSKIKDYLENKYKNSSYEEYEACISRPVDIYLPGLWAEFFRSGAGYENVIPKERPDVAYFTSDTDIPRFIFEKPYASEYSEQEFCTRFIREWDTTHYNPYYDDCNDPVCYADYKMELADRPRNAYLYYLCSVGRFKHIRQRLKQTAEADKGNVL